MTNMDEKRAMLAKLVERLKRVHPDLPLQEAFARVTFGGDPQADLHFADTIVRDVLAQYRPAVSSEENRRALVQSLERRRDQLKHFIDALAEPA